MKMEKMINKRVLIACEESQAVTKEMRLIGLEAYSCDIQRCSGGYSEYHIRLDVRLILNEQWDMIIAFPPCTNLAVSGARWFKEKIKDNRQQDSINFFMLFVNANCNRIAIENPIGIMSTVYRKPDQIIQPWQFGHSVSKSTCLWLKNLPLLKPTNIVKKDDRIRFNSNKIASRWCYNTFRINPLIRSKIRSKTFSGIAKAMAIQWGNLLLKEDNG